MRHLSSATIALLLATAFRAHAQSAVTLISPGSVQPSIEELIPAFEAKTGRKVTATFASGGVTRQQVMRGEIFDVIILQPPYPEVLATGNVNAGSAVTLVTVALGIAGRKGAPKPDISTPEAVKRVLLASRGVAYPDEPGGASGIAFLKVLDQLGIRQQMEPKLKHGGTGGSTMELVVSGEADYGITFMSGMNRPGVEAIGPIPSELAPPTGYVGFLSANAKDPAAGKALLDYLASPAAAHAYTSRGFKAGQR